LNFFKGYVGFNKCFANIYDYDGGAIDDNRLWRDKFKVDELINSLPCRFQQVLQFLDEVPYSKITLKM
jgi:hypothetical protein